CLARSRPLVRGSCPPPKPAAEGSGDEEHPSKPLPTGLLMFGGGAYSNFRDAGILFCGNAPCTARTTGFTYTFGVDVWLTRFVGVEGGYLHPHEVSASGGDGTFTFKSTLESDLRPPPATPTPPT